MKQVIYNICRIKKNGELAEETKQSGIGYLTENELIIATMSKPDPASGKQPKPILKTFALPKNNFQSYNGWTFGTAEYIVDLPDTTTFIQTWKLSYTDISTADKVHEQKIADAEQAERDKRAKADEDAKAKAKK